MKVAAYQAPLRATSSFEVVGLIREQVERCEAEGVEILCCPEGVLGGLADYASRPADIAVDVDAGRLDEMPVFTVGGLTFGIVICRDSTFPEPARIMASRGAAALFVPTNNGLPPSKGGPELVAQARGGDVARAVENGVSVIRADVAGRTERLTSYGASGIVDSRGVVLCAARPLVADLVVADIHTAPRGRREPRA